MAGNMSTHSGSRVSSETGDSSRDSQLSLFNPRRNIGARIFTRFRPFRLTTIQPTTGKLFRAAPNSSFHNLYLLPPILSTLHRFFHANASDHQRSPHSIHLFKVSKNGRAPFLVPSVGICGVHHKQWIITRTQSTRGHLNEITRCEI